MVEIDKRWIAVDDDDRIIARGATRSRVHYRLIQQGLNPADYEVVAVPEVPPPTGVGWGF